MSFSKIASLPPVCTNPFVSPVVPGFNPEIPCVLRIADLDKYQPHGLEQKFGFPTMSGSVNGVGIEVSATPTGIMLQAPFGVFVPATPQESAKLATAVGAYLTANSSHFDQSEALAWDGMHQALLSAAGNQE